MWNKKKTSNFWHDCHEEYLLDITPPFNFLCNNESLWVLTVFANFLTKFEVNFKITES